MVGLNPTTILGMMVHAIAGGMKVQGQPGLDYKMLTQKLNK
jgi:hypothetical protein